MQNWVQNWEYDRYGNRTGFTQDIAGVTTAPNPAVDPLTNRFAAGQGFTYDANGNVISDVDPVTAQMRSFVFNGDNKQSEVRDANGVAIAKYSYDGEGKRVKKEVIATGETTVFVYSSGKLVAEYSTAAPPATPQVSYTTTDHLGSPRVITNSFGQVTSRRDFLPFGEDIVANVGGRTAALKYGTTDTIRQKFTGYQKDLETGLDFAEARMYENRHGRFTAVDPLLASGKSANPQSFNRYLYTSNNPVISTDPSGQCPTGQCPRDWTGSVYTKTLTDKNGASQTLYNNERPDDSWTPFTGDVVYTVSGAEGRSAGEYHITASGWTEITGERLAIQSLLTGHQQGLNDIRNGSEKGVGNIPIDLANTATGLAWTFRNGSLAPDTFSPNPMAFERYHANNDREARWSFEVEVGLLSAPGFAAAPFTATRALSVVPEMGTTANLVERSPDVLGHIFRQSVGHVSPRTAASQNRYLNLFENVANDSTNASRGVLSAYQRSNPGFTGFSRTFNNGQVWVQVRNNRIFDAGVNSIPR